MEQIASSEMNNNVLESSTNNTTTGMYSTIDDLLNLEYSLNINLFEALKDNNVKDINIIKNKIGNKDVYDIVYHKFFLNSMHMDECFSNYTFKNKNRYKFFNSLFEHFPIKINKTLTDLYYNMLLNVIKIDKGQYLLKKIQYKEIVNELSEEKIKDLYFNSGVSSTLPVFLLIDELFDNRSYLDNCFRSILSAACRNADIRILKYIVNNFHKYHDPSWNNINFIKVLINNLFSNHIPLKYVLRRIKIINSKINLSPYFHVIINYINDIDTLLILNKYYNDGYKLEGHNVNVLTELVQINPCSETVQKILSIFNSLDDSMVFMFNVFLYNKTFYGIDIMKHINTNNISIISSYVNRITESIFDTGEDELYNTFNEADLKVIFTICQPDITKFYNPHKMKYFMFMLPYIDYFPTITESWTKKFNKYAIKLNLLKFTIKIWLRKNHKVLKLENKIKKIRLKEKNGETSIKNSSRQEFTKLPPRHLIPYELDMITKTNDGFYLIKEKADGCLVDFLSVDVVPVINEYSKNIIKAEFIEELDLYLIFDMKKDNMNIIERYDYIRKLHPTTSKCLPILESKCIESFDDLVEAVREERKLFEEFLKLPYKNYRVYPKAAWLVKSMKHINQSVIENIIEEKDSNFICNEGPYQNDGLIITPLNGRRELKIKPKSMHTIDLLYNGRNWIDREKNVWNHIIKNKETFSPNTIWRCYPIFEKNENGYYLFEAREYRYDKTKPNNNKIVNIIYKLHLINWKNEGNKLDSEGYKFFYHDNTNIIKNNSWSDIRNIQNKHLEKILNKIEPNIKSMWLDLGCGSSKLLEFIKKYHFSEYVGLDFDINQLVKAVNRIDSNQYYLNNARVMPANLSEDWNSHKLSWDIFDYDKKYDYIVANFSLAHFYNDSFWEKLESVSKKDTYFIFNIVNSSAKNKWEKDGSYLYIDKNIVKYYLKNIHNSEMIEKFISEEEIISKITFNNWELVNNLRPIGNNLDSKYTWYVVKHN